MGARHHHTVRRVASHFSFLAVSAAACASSPSPGRVCTDLFAYVTAVVVDSAGHPVNGLSIRDSVLRTRQAFDVTDQSLGIVTPGSYVIFSDNELRQVRGSGDSVLVTGTNEGAEPGIGAGSGFSAMYMLGSDGCHVRKVGGADTVVAGA